MRPRWSPDGKQILFTSNRDGNYEIYLLDLESGKQQRLTRHQEQDNFACWHPDGKQLAWVRENQGRFDICRMPLANSAR
jgi:TolB protein